VQFLRQVIRTSIRSFSFVRTGTKATVSFFISSVCPHVSRGRISVIFDIGDFYVNLSRKFKFGCSQVKNRGTLRLKTTVCLIVTAGIISN